MKFFSQKSVCKHKIDTINLYEFDVNFCHKLKNYVNIYVTTTKIPGF